MSPTETAVADPVPVATDPFGMTMSGMPRTWFTNPRAQYERFSAMAAQDLARARRGTWPKLPSRILPGDWPAIRSSSLGVAGKTSTVELFGRVLDEVEQCGANGQTPDAEMEWRLRTLVEQLAKADFVNRAVPFYLDSADAVAVTGAYAPDADVRDLIRLPYPEVAVFFASPMRIAPDSGWWSTSLLDDLIDYDNGIAQEYASHGVVPDTRYLRDPEAGLTEWELLAVGGCDIIGVIVEAAPDATGTYLPHVRDDVMWIASPLDRRHQHHGVAARYVGSLPTSKLAPVVANLLAAVSWGDWECPTPDPDLPAPGTPARRKAAKTSSFQRKAADGSLDGVHRIRLGTRRSGGTGGDGGRSVRTHWRRGHFRRTRVGTRLNWRYDLRFIAPTIVNADVDSTSPSPAVYLLPEPAGAVPAHGTPG